MPYCCARVIPYFVLVLDETGPNTRAFRFYRHRTTIPGARLLYEGSLIVASRWRTWEESREVVRHILSIRSTTPFQRSFKKEDARYIRTHIDHERKPTT